MARVMKLNPTNLYFPKSRTQKRKERWCGLRILLFGLSFFIDLWFGCLHSLQGRVRDRWEFWELVSDPLSLLLHLRKPRGQVLGEGLRNVGKLREEVRVGWDRALLLLQRHEQMFGQVFPPIDILRWPNGVVFCFVFVNGRKLKSGSRFIRSRWI